MVFVTTYKNPDLDGIACSIAYVELLTKQDVKAKAVYAGDLGLEVGFVKNYCKSFPVEKKENKYAKEDKFILVDTSDPKEIDSSIPGESVIQIFDHRAAAFLDKFPNSKSIIELVGSCATLITEELQKEKCKPSKIAATYLYSAIVSNTINFKNTVTTDRDKDAAKYLKSLLSLPSNYIEKMFVSKSTIDEANFKQVLMQDFKMKIFKEKRIGIAQLEVANLDKLILTNKDVLQETLTKLNKSKKLDYLLFCGIDILKGFNLYMVIDEKSKKFFSKVLELENFPMVKKVDGILMRKQIFSKANKALL